MLQVRDHKLLFFGEVHFALETCEIHFKLDLLLLLPF